MKQLFQLSAGSLRAVSLATLLLLSALMASAQNNPYEIDDICYDYFSKAELSVGTDAFQPYADSLLQRAIICGDRKAQTLFYVEKLKNLTRLGVKPGAPNMDAQVDAAHEELKMVAEQMGYMQYFYYSYDLCQTYYFRRGMKLRAFSLTQEMQNISIERGDDYGTWMSYRFMISLYLAMDDFVSARKAARMSIDTYYKSSDPLVRRQSISRSYFDLADTYPVFSDSMRLNVNNGFKTSKQHLDSLRANYYMAVIHAFDDDKPKYHQCRDYCMTDPALVVISPSAHNMFNAIDAMISNADYDHVVSFSSQVASLRELKFMANIAEAHMRQSLAFRLEKRIVKSLEAKLASEDQLRISELNAQLDLNRLNADLNESELHVARVTRLLAVLISVLLLLALVFTIIQMRQLSRRKDKDEAMIADLTAANEKVRLADAAKTRFVQNMSHEVRTPLNAIVGFSQLLSLPDGSFSPEEKDEFSGHIINNTKMLTMLLDDILNASAMDSGKYRISLEEGEMHFICQAAISSSEHRLQPGVTMTYEPEQEEPFNFVTDPRRVQQILINLLTNSCKHTIKGSIVLRSSLTQHPGMVTFTVTDTGSGVPADKAEAIFDRFTKLNEFVQGTGLGLSICRDIATRMGAKVYLDTTYTEGGARFVFEVPVTPPDITD